MVDIKTISKRKPTGQTQLPLTRVKKIIAVDPDITTCSNNAAFLITLAAELFVQHLATESHTATKLDRKPRRNIQYKDVATAVAHNDHFEFLEDIVPKTQPLRKIKEQAAATRAGINGDKKVDEVPTNRSQKQLINGSGMLGLTGLKPGHDALEDDVEMDG
ncbi:putative transcription factor C16C4.22 [Ceratocystis lukuohia]|uniref:Transcription factor C16C4.22 n=2 Tax=Ceratocystis TaxID=5157 RepID=A0ABR4MQ75_9PEZI|nr:putative transcription factor C16C4.22 [Ceratocystis platani]